MLKFQTDDHGAFANLTLKVKVRRQHIIATVRDLFMDHEVDINSVTRSTVKTRLSKNLLQFGGLTNWPTNKTKADSETETKVVFLSELLFPEIRENGE
jgi:hypothetical protein